MKPTKSTSDPVITDKQRQRLLGWLYGWAHSAELAYNRVQPNAEVTMGDRQADAMQFVVSIAKVEQLAAVLLGSDHAAVRRFREAEPGVRPIRNALEHVDEYLTGRGHLQPGVVPIDRFKVGFRSDDHTMVLTVGDLHGPGSRRVRRVHATVPCRAGRTGRRRVASYARLGPAPNCAFGTTP